MRNKRARSLAGALVVVLAVVSTGCVQRLAVNETIQALDEGAVVMDRESDPKFARQALPSNLKTFEALLINAPDNEKLLRRLSEGYFSYAFAFLEQDLNEAQIALADQARIEELAKRTILHYMRARDYGFRLLDRQKFREAALDLEVERVDKLLGEMTEEDVPGLFWSAFSWGAAIKLGQQDSQMVAARPVVERMMRRVVELQPSYYDWGPHRFLGVYYASRPKGAGGNPDEAKRHFEIALKHASERNLTIPFLYGRYWGAQTGNREFFKKMMKRVTSAKLGEYPDNRLTNEVAKVRAEFWTKHADDLFYD